MATEILKSFGTLQSELEQAKTSLKGVDENIKRLIGRDPSDTQPPGQRAFKRPQLVQTQDESNPAKHRWTLGSNRRVYMHENEEPPPKRRGGVFNRLADRVPERQSYRDEESDFKGHGHKQMISKVIVTPKEVPSRQDALDAQSGDEKFKARNRRMFGALLGTLQKFQQEETKLKPKEDKRAQLEKKIEETEIREKAEIKKERQELFQNRKQKQAEIKMIELKMQKMRTYAQWEETQRKRMNFIQTKSEPSIHYLPKKLNDANKMALGVTKENIEKLIEERKQEVYEELQVLEDKMKFNSKQTQNTDDNDNENDSDKESDDNNDEEMKEDGKNDETDDKPDIVMKEDITDTTIDNSQVLNEEEEKENEEKEEITECNENVCENAQTQ